MFFTLIFSLAGCCLFCGNVGKSEFLLLFLGPLWVPSASSLIYCWPSCLLEVFWFAFFMGCSITYLLAWHFDRYCAACSPFWQALVTFSYSLDVTITCQISHLIASACKKTHT